MKFKKIEFGRQANFLLAIVLIHFVFFGYISNRYKKSIGENIFYLHTILFNPYSLVSFIILFLIVFLMVFRENFFEYGIRNSIWITPIIMGESWFWYIFTTSSLDVFAAIGRFFTSYQGYLTIFSLLTINVFTAILAAIAKEKYKEYLKKVTKIDIET